MGGSYSLANRKTVFQLFDNAVIHFASSASFSKGTHVLVRGNGRLSVGQKFFCNANCDILCNKSIVFGEDDLLGWNITVLDADGHDTYFKGVKQEAMKGIMLGTHVWVGAKSTILKGVNLSDSTIVPYGSIIYKSNEDSNVVFQNKILKSDIEWHDI